MSTPILLLVGQAGSGKDTVAQLIGQGRDVITLAFADPMKRLAKLVFGFSDEQLWGPSEARNAPDPRYARGAQATGTETFKFWNAADWILGSHMGKAWLRDLFDSTDVHVQYRGLEQWLYGLRDTGEGDLTPRAALQTLGTEWGRNWDRDLWVNYGIRTAQKLLGGGYRYSRDRGLIEDRDYPGPSLVVVTDGRFRNEVLGVKRVGGKVVRLISPAGTTLSGAAAEHASEQEQAGIPHHWLDAVFTNDKRRGLESLGGSVEVLMQHLFYDGPTFGNARYHEVS